mmetsp:Transcript_57716/g.182830  ORF Transcript_57716/g.182830 Transcript_57716/m.182830 type:complete len:390 (+) Transcript_57716:116-1285(+)
MRPRGGLALEWKAAAEVAAVHLDLEELEGAPEAAPQHLLPQGDQRLAHGLGTEVHDADCILERGGGVVGDHHLPPVGHAGDARCMVDDRPEVVGAPGQVAGDPPRGVSCGGSHLDAQAVVHQGPFDLHPGGRGRLQELLTPLYVQQHILRLYHELDRQRGAREDEEEVPHLLLALVPPHRREAVPDALIVLPHRRVHRPPRHLVEVGGPVDKGEDDCHPQPRGRRIVAGGELHGGLGAGVVGAALGQGLGHHHHEVVGEELRLHLRGRAHHSGDHRVGVRSLSKAAAVPQAAVAVLELGVVLGGVLGGALEGLRGAVHGASGRRRPRQLKVANAAIHLNIDMVDEDISFLLGALNSRAHHCLIRLSALKQAVHPKMRHQGRSGWRREVK